MVAVAGKGLVNGYAIMKPIVLCLVASFLMVVKEDGNTSRQLSEMFFRLRSVIALKECQEWKSKDVQGALSLKQEIMEV